tara:strand:+ start:199 stop:510 length:312 start_codon:yes stop_codon:yes gene_type:complete
MLFKNLKEAHLFYKYPSTHRFGTIGNDKGVLRSYSNGLNCDRISKDEKTIFYRIKNDRIKKMYMKNIISKKKIRFFKKVNNGVLDMGLYLPIKFSNDFVKLVK